MSASFFAKASSFSSQQVFIPKFFACSRLWAISSINIDWFGSNLNFSMSFLYGSKWGFGTKFASVISKAPSNRSSIPNCLVTFLMWSWEPFENIYFFSLIFINYSLRSLSLGNQDISISCTKSKNSLGSIFFFFIYPDNVVPYS